MAWAEAPRQVIELRLKDLGSLEEETVIIDFLRSATIGLDKEGVSGPCDPDYTLRGRPSVNKSVQLGH